LASSYEQVRDKLMLDPNLFDKMAVNQSFIQATKHIKDAAANSDTFINYLESVGFDKLREAGESVDREVGLFFF
jgi:hypothetical protein